MKIVYISGVFDLFHYGHMKLINECKKKFPNDSILIGVHNDIDCKSYKRKPVMTMKERVLTIKESGMVDNILENAPLLEDKEFYEKNKIDIVVHAHSKDTNDFYINKFYKYASDNNMFIRLDYTCTISTSNIVERIS